MDANALGMKVSEFEGDAVLFYRSGPPPALKDLVEQSKKMFVGFHSHLKKFEFHRICQCGACSGANRLALKIIAHFGSAATMQVKDHVKFIGKDVIVAHRLLKNSVPEREYLLVTNESLDRLPDKGAEVAQFASGADAYDELGTLQYRYTSLARYMDDVKVEPPPPFALPSPVRVMEISRRINAPAERVFQLLIDLPGRMKWIDGIKTVEFRDDLPNQIGKQHRCVREGKDPEVVTSEVRITDVTMEFWETDIKKMGALRYLLRRAAADTTDASLEFFVRGNILVRLLFKALLERKLKRAFERSLANLAALCEVRAK